MILIPSPHDPRLREDVSWVNRTSETGKIKRYCNFLSPGGPQKKFEDIFLCKICIFFPVVTVIFSLCHFRCNKMISGYVLSGKTWKYKMYVRRNLNNKLRNLMHKIIKGLKKVDRVKHKPKNSEFGTVSTHKI